MVAGITMARHFSCTYTEPLQFNVLEPAPGDLFVVFEFLHFSDHLYDVGGAVCPDIMQGVSNWWLMPARLSQLASSPVPGKPEKQRWKVQAGTGLQHKLCNGCFQTRAACLRSYVSASGNLWSHEPHRTRHRFFRWGSPELRHCTQTPRPTVRSR